MTLPETSANKECPNLQALNGFCVLQPINQWLFVVSQA
jgi:hypothetical protein